ncbi:MAG: J domain-containing protein [Alkalinema sp. RL_2_19]|nr:J domain-containing protein [Alkalinema sp. RL_2_19]
MPVSEFDRYYEILEIAPGAKPEVVKQAYRRLARRWHPDRFAALADKAIAEVKFKQISQAYEQLKEYVPPAQSFRPPPKPSSQSGSSKSDSSRSDPPAAESKSPPASKPRRTPPVPPRGSPRSLYQMAVDYTHAGKYEAAIACLGVAIKRQPDYAMAYRYRGHLRSLLSFDRSAAADFRKADQLEKSAPPPAPSGPMAVPPVANSVLSPAQIRLRQLGPVTAMAWRPDANLLMTGVRRGRSDFGICERINV